MTAVHHTAALLERLGTLFANLRVGPAAMDLDVGPLIRQTQQQRVWDSGAMRKVVD